MKKYLSFILLLFCSCAFVYHGEGKDEEWANAYKISQENIEKKNWDFVEIDKKSFGVFNKNYFEKDGFKSKKSSVVIISTMHNYSANRNEPGYDPLNDLINTNLINTIPCIIYINNINVNSKNKEKYMERIKQIKNLKMNNFKFLGYINTFQLKEEMFYKHDESFIKIYYEYKDILLDKSIDIGSFGVSRLDELNNLLIEKGYNQFKETPLTNGDYVVLNSIRIIIEQSEKYYQLGYKYPCFECTLK